MTKLKQTDYRICDLQGRCIAVHQRIEKQDGTKTFVWCSPAGSKGLKGTPVADLPLYGTEKLAARSDGALVLLVEGEKAAESLMTRGAAAVGTVTGAKTTPSVASLSVLKRFNVVVWPDNDPDGQDHMSRITLRLGTIGCVGLRWLEWRDAPEKGDAADFEGGEEALDALVQTANVHRMPDKTDLTALFNDLASFVSKYLRLGAHELVAIVLWVAHTWAFEAADFTPYLAITSVEKQSGKTRLLEVLELLAKGPWLIGRTSTAALIRKIERDTPTVLLDETDAAFHGDTEYAETLRSILNSGYRRGAVVTLAAKGGSDFDIRDFAVFCPKALAGIGDLPDTVTDRSIPILMKRRLPGETVSRFRRNVALGDSAIYRERLETWAEQAIPLLMAPTIEIPEELGDRATDVWEPLLVIAELAGVEWSKKARESAVQLSGISVREDQSLGVQLLSNIRSVLLQVNVDRVFSNHLALALCHHEEWPWGDIKGRAMDARLLARMLKPYGIRPQQIRIEDDSLKGYYATDFQEAWDRYIPPLEETGETTETTAPYKHEEATDAVSLVSDVSVPAGVRPRGTILSGKSETDQAYGEV